MIKNAESRKSTGEPIFGVNPQGRAIALGPNPSAYLGGMREGKIY